jgi:hypothetical protein
MALSPPWSPSFPYVRLHGSLLSAATASGGGFFVSSWSSSSIRLMTLLIPFNWLVG